MAKETAGVSNKNFHINIQLDGTISIFVVAPHGARRRRRRMVSVVRAAARAPVNLLLQDDAVHRRLEQCKRHARLALEVAQAVEDVGRGVGGEIVQERGELSGPLKLAIQTSFSFSIFLFFFFCSVFFWQLSTIGRRKGQ